MILYWIARRARTFVPEEFRVVRLMHNKSQAEIASALRITRQQVSNWERGQGAPGKDVAETLFLMLGNDAHRVFPEVQ